MSETPGDRGSGEAEGSPTGDDQGDLKKEKRKRLEELFRKYGSVSSRPVTAEYLSGFIDGEGCISLHKVGKKSGNTYRYPVIELAQHAGHGLSDIARDWDGNLSDHSEIGAKLIRWSSRESIKYLLQATLPYLRLKKRHAELILEYYDATPERKQEIITIFKTINKRETWQ